MLVAAAAEQSQLVAGLHPSYLRVPRRGLRQIELVAQVLEMGRKAVVVRVGPACATLPEMPQRLTLALGMPANERMDTLVE
ncbi:MAG: hypothetical protein ACKOD9_07835, partial [Rubrivivax sp.]